MEITEAKNWLTDVSGQSEQYPILKSIPELKVVFTQELGQALRNYRNLPDLTLENVPESEDGLKSLLRNNQLGEAFLLTTKLLDRPLAEDTMVESTLKFWQTRLNLYIRFGAFNEAKVELDQFTQFEDLPIQFGQNSIHGGVPFTLLLSVAHLHLAGGQLEVAESKLSKLLHQCNENIAFFEEKGNESFVKLWKDRESKVLTMLINYGIEKNDFKFAISLVKNLRERQTDPQDIGRSEALIGKMFILFGDIKSAEEHFEESMRFSSGIETQLNGLLNKGLVQIANNDYQGAHDTYSEARGFQPDNVTFTNNMAVSALYLGRSSEGIQLLESTLKAGLIRPATIGNLCALYRLQSSQGESKKVALQQTVAQTGPLTFNCQALETEN